MSIHDSIGCPYNYDFLQSSEEEGQDAQCSDIPLMLQLAGRRRCDGRKGATIVFSRTSENSVSNSFSLVRTAGKWL